jgi:hypothetical protein
VLCFVRIGTVDDRFTQRDDDAQNYLVPRIENNPMRISTFQVHKRRKIKVEKYFSVIYECTHTRPASPGTCAPISCSEY